MLECASDASVRGQRKTVAVWMGNRKMEEEIMLKRNVKGLQHDSRRAEMDGIILAMQVLMQVNDKYGMECKTRLGCNNAEVVGKWKERGVSLLPSKSYSRNMDMMLKRDSLTGEYHGSIEVVKVKGNQED